MSFSTIITLFTALIVLAIIPGPGVLIVASRTISGGLKAGIVTTLGLIAGDLIYITVAIAGLASLTNIYYELFSAIRYIGAAYLIYLAINLIFRKDKELMAEPKYDRGTTHFIAGVLTTLSNPKAMLFYLSFFPSFIDLNNLTAISVAEIFLVTASAIGSVMLAYAYATSRGGNLLRKGSFAKFFKYIAGTALAGTAIAVISRN